MEAGELKRDVFMDHIEQVTRDLVERVRNGDIPDEAYATVEAPCPKCGGVGRKTTASFSARNVDFSLWVVVSGREWAPEEIAELIQNALLARSTVPQPHGQAFFSGIRLTNELKIEFDFGQARLEEERPIRPISAARKAWALPQSSARGVRVRHGVRLRGKRSVRSAPAISARQDDPAATRRARSDAEAAHHRPH